MSKEYEGLEVSEEVYDILTEQAMRLSSAEDDVEHMEDDVRELEARVRELEDDAEAMGGIPEIMSTAKTAGVSVNILTLLDKTVQECGDTYGWHSEEYKVLDAIMNELK